jgi:DnaJ-class molecular chaperone
MSLSTFLHVTEHFSMDDETNLSDDRGVTVLGEIPGLNPQLRHNAVHVMNQAVRAGYQLHQSLSITSRGGFGIRHIFVLRSHVGVATTAGAASAGSAPPVAVDAALSSAEEHALTAAAAAEEQKKAKETSAESAKKPCGICKGAGVTGTAKTTCGLCRGRGFRI